MNNWLKRSRNTLIVTLMLYVVSLFFSLANTDLSDIKNFSLSVQQENIIKLVGVIFVALITISIMAVEYAGLKFIFKRMVTNAEIAHFKILFFTNYATKFLFISVINFFLPGQISVFWKGFILIILLSVENYFIIKSLISKNNKATFFLILPFLIIAIL